MVKSIPVVLTRQIMANRAVRDYKNSYVFPVYASEKSTKSLSLSLLGENPDPDTVDSIIGNKSWTTTPICALCSYDGLVVEFCEDMDHDSQSRTTWVCKECLDDAVKAMNNAIEAMNG